MSPIKGISEVIRLPRLGKIHLGNKKYVEGTPYLEATDHFICPEEVKKVFGEQPRKLPIMFPTNDPSQWASQYLKCYSESQRLVCRGNGKTAIARGKGGVNDAELREKQCVPMNCPAYQQDICRPVMNLQFLIPKCPGFGVYQLDTGSYHSMVNINSSLELIHAICNRFAMIPLTLNLIEKDVQPKGQSKTAWVLSLLPTYSLIETQRYAQMPTERALVLPPPDSEPPDDLLPKGIPRQDVSKNQQVADEELVQFWDKAKIYIWSHDLQDYQIARYFMKHFHLEVGLKDFISTLPSTKFNIANLSGFLKDVESYIRFS